MTSPPVLEAILPQPETPAYFMVSRRPRSLSGAKQDAIFPVNCGELYQQALANATLHVIDRCGHSPALETAGVLHCSTHLSCLAVIHTTGALCAMPYAPLGSGST